MVFLTISPTILEALEEVQLLDRDTVRNPHKSLELLDERSLLKKDGKYAEVTKHLDGGQEVEGIEDKEISFGRGESKEQFNEPPLSSPKLGNPISHGQVIDLWKELKARSHRPRSLDSLLRGARVYSPPPESKPEPVSAISLSAYYQRWELDNRLTSGLPDVRIQGPDGSTAS